MSGELGLLLMLLKPFYRLLYGGLLELVKN